MNDREIIIEKIKPLIKLGYDVDDYIKNTFDFITVTRGSKIIQLDLLNKLVRFHDSCFGQISSLTFEEVCAIKDILCGEGEDNEQ